MLWSIGCWSSAYGAELRVPDALRQVVPLLQSAEETTSLDLVYEGNNALMREGLQLADPNDGQALAERWRALAHRTAGMFVLRDSLWNQQDHPTRTTPHRLMLPPSWLLVAATSAAPQPVRWFDEEDDAGWATLADETTLFGAYPPSATLFALATGSLRTADEDRRIRMLNARRSLRQLGELTEALHHASPAGWRAVVSTGARLIAESDRAYFGIEARHDRIIPIFVENPAPHEIGEGKGYVVPGLDAPTEIERFLVYEICRQRLQDGDIALERYDLSDPGDVARAFDILEHVIPPGESLGTRVWLWVNGKLLPGKSLNGASALDHTATFLRAAAERPIDLERLRLFGKPVVPLGPDLAEIVTRHRAVSLWMSVDVGAHDLVASHERVVTGQ